MAKENSKPIDFKDKDYPAKIERACVKGQTVILQDIGEELDPTLVNIIAKAYITIGRKRKVMVGDRELDWHKNFQLYITTKYSNPVFETSIFANTTVVNFCVTEFALEEQCLGIVVQQEAPQIETTKNENINKIAMNNAKLEQLENDILSALQADKGIPLLEDVELIETLNSAKEASEEAKTAADTLRIAMKKIMENRENYRPIGRQASTLYFVLFDLPIVDPMY